MQANHKANEERKNCILDINDVQGHADNLRSKSRQDFNNSLSPRRFVTSSSLLASALWLVLQCHGVLPWHIGGAFAKPYGRILQCSPICRRTGTIKVSDEASLRKLLRIYSATVRFLDDGNETFSPSPRHEPHQTVGLSDQELRSPTHALRYMYTMRPRV